MPVGLLSLGYYSSVQTNHIVYSLEIINEKYGQSLMFIDLSYISSLHNWNNCDRP